MKPRRTTLIALGIWAITTLILLTSIVFIAVRWGQVGFDLFIQEGVFTHLPTTLASLAITWLLAGTLAYLIHTGQLNAGNFFTWAGFFLVTFLYLNILRERFRYGDISYYLEAATRLANHQPLPESYYYFPFWATLVELLIPLGEEVALLAIWILNVLALFAFYFLLGRVLEHYNFSSRLAALVTTGFMLANTPLLRTLVYGQINLHVMNAIFLSLLLFRRSPWFSALCLALAVQLKTSPMVLLLAFLLERDWRWLAWFVIGNFALASITVLVDGTSPFLDVLHNVTLLAGGRNAIFHDNSFDSFFGFPAQVFAISDSTVPILVYAAKGLLAISVLAVFVRALRSKAFFSMEGRAARLLNTIPPLFILMTLASPVVWVHHGVFLSLAFLLLFKKLDSPAHWYLYGFAYLLQFILPTFDFYPWSYGRLIAPLLCLWLLWRNSLQASVSPWFVRFNQWFDALPAFPATPV
jgi:hypothetical protein